VVEQTKKGKAVPVEEEELDRLYEQGWKVIVVPDPGIQSEVWIPHLSGIGPGSGVGAGTFASKCHLWGSAAYAARLFHGVWALQGRERGG
jgi:hypothetical protein